MRGSGVDAINSLRPMILRPRPEDIREGKRDDPRREPDAGIVKMLRGLWKSVIANFSSHFSGV